MLDSGHAEPFDFGLPPWDGYKPWEAQAQPLPGGPPRRVRTRDLEEELSALMRGNTELQECGAGGFIITQATGTKLTFLHDGRLLRAGWLDDADELPTDIDDEEAARLDAPDEPAIAAAGGNLAADAAGLVAGAVGGAGAAAGGAGSAPPRPLYRLLSGAVSDSGAVTCVICCEEIAAQGLVFSECSHMFCRMCGELYLASKLRADTKHAVTPRELVRSLGRDHTVDCPTCRRRCTLGGMLLVSQGLPLSSRQDLLRRTDRRGNSALHHAAALGLPLTYAALRAAGADDSEPNKDGRTAADLLEASTSA